MAEMKCLHCGGGVQLMTGALGSTRTHARKRLQHAANTLCHMFCGWRQISSRPQLVSLGSGVLTLDILSGTSTFEDRPVEDLSILGELRSWLLRDLSANNIPLSALDEARLDVHMQFSAVSWDERYRNEQFFAEGKELKNAPMHKCEFRCRSLIRTGPDQYASAYVDEETWPIGWPKA